MIEEILKSYIARGWSIIPTKSDKRPVMTSWVRCQNTPMTYDEFMQEVKDGKRHGRDTAGVALVTGKVSGVTVVDFDLGSKDIFDSVMTPIAKTGSGGRHYYFKYTPRLSQTANPKLRIDIRNDGGYAIMPPSKSTKGEYEWIISPDEVPLAEVPDFFIDLYQPENVKTPVSFKPASEGHRNVDSTRVIGKLIDTLRDDLELAWASVQKWNDTNNPPIEEEQLRATFEWCVKKDARNNPTPTASSFEELLDKNIASIFDTNRVSGISTGYKWFDQKSRGIMSGVLTVVAGQTSVGKSLLVMNLIDKILKDYKVAYFDLENGVAEMLERFTRIRFNLKKEFYEKPENMQKIKELVKGQFDNLSYYHRGTGIRDHKALLTAMLEEVRRGVKVIVIDPLQKIEGGDDLEQQGKIAGDLSDFAQTHGVAVILCHHVRKATNAGGKYIADDEEVQQTRYLDPSIEDIKGGSIITDTAECVWTVVRKFASVGDSPQETKIKRATTVLKILKCRSNNEAIGNYVFYLDGDTLRMNGTLEECSFYPQNLLNSVDL